MKTSDLLEILKCCYSFPNKYDTRQSFLTQNLRGKQKIWLIFSPLNQAVPLELL